jgi:4-hydroxy-2-oxoheptanedioate aldolase
MKTNSMKAKLLAGEPVLGCSIMIPSPQAVEMIAHCGFDWVLIDLEHGTIDLETAEIMIMVAEANRITPIARPRTNRKEDIMRSPLPGEKLKVPDVVWSRPWDFASLTASQNTISIALS